MLAVGMLLLLLGLPGGIVLELAQALGFARSAHGAGAWPMMLFITFAGSVLIVPMSVALRHKRPDIVGWRHAGITALLMLAATFIFTLVVAR